MNELEKILGIKFPLGISITHATNSSKKVKKDSIFFGIQGTQIHGSKYINEALINGASIAVHNDPKYKANNKNVFYIKDLEDGKTEIIAANPEEDLEQFLSHSDKSKIFRFLYEFYYHESNISLVDCDFLGFTGTNGKTTSAFFCHQILSQLGAESIYIGTLGFQYKNNKFNNSISSKTTPDIFELYEIFELINFQVRYVCIELSSHALDQGRLNEIDFCNVSLMNIGNDHLDYHATEEDYADAKFKVFDLHDSYTGVAIDDNKPQPTNNVSGIELESSRGYWDKHESPGRLINIDSTFPDNISKKVYMDLAYHPKAPKCANLNVYNDGSIIKAHILKEAETAKKITEKWRFPIPVLYGRDSENRKQVETISQKNLNANYFYKILKNEINSAKFRITYTKDNEKKVYEFTCNIFPEYNLTNLVFALVTIIKIIDRTEFVFFECPMAGTEFGGESWHPHKFTILNIDAYRPPSNLEFLKLPKGRAELIKGINKNIIIDYAHNVEGIILFLCSIKQYFRNLVVIFGCGGDRDKFKRPKMLKAAIENSALVIFTSDNSRSENFDLIYKDAIQGNNSENVKVIKDRREAIIYGSKLISGNDCLVILGKGHEETQESQGNVIRYSDHEVVNEIYK